MTQWIKYIGFPKDHFKLPVYTWPLIVLWLSIPLLYTVYGRILYVQRIRKRRSSQKITPNINEVVIVVLGDLGHSPRMTYHARSFQKLGYQVNLCGYLESDLPEFLRSPDFSIYNIPVIKNTRNLPYLIFAGCKVLSQIINLTFLLKDILDDNTRFVLVQNPPSLPILLILGLLKKYWAPNIKLVIDWHNLNWSILNLKYHNENHPVVRAMKYYEKFCGKHFADLNLTVTSALQNYLIEEFRLSKDKIVTLYDRPSEIFQPLDSQKSLKDIVQRNSSIFSDTGYNQLTDRILITSTSFTADEDFTVLVNALVTLEQILSSQQSKNNIIMIITGKGPLKSKFLNMVKSHKWQHVKIKSLWLPILEYRSILKIADLGISLHYSSSGLDLPMKIVDLFGSGVPVLSMNYPAIGELVKENINGVILQDNKDGKEMANKIYSTLFDDKSSYIKIKEGALLESQRRWDDEWNTKLSEKFLLSNESRV